MCVDTRNSYEKAFDASMDEEGRVKFWGELAKEVDWFVEPKTVLGTYEPPLPYKNDRGDEGELPRYRWFKDGMVNICYNCVDRWVKTQPDACALAYDSNMCNVKKQWTFK